jgi:hypothetical protein
MNDGVQLPAGAGAAVMAEPCAANGFLGAHVRLLAASLRHWTGRALIPPDVACDDQARWLFAAPFAVLSHGSGADPLFTYANRTALTLFELDWATLVSLSSRLSAEPVARAERERLLAAVTARGYIDDYAGVRISRRGRRFSIQAATVWNLIEADGRYCGQAAMFAHWHPLATATAALAQRASKKVDPGAS